MKKVVRETCVRVRSAMLRVNEILDKIEHNEEVDAQTLLSVTKLLQSLGSFIADDK